LHLHHVPTLVGDTLPRIFEHCGCVDLSMFFYTLPVTGIGF
jgi:hypothetical protein